jgi:subtilisin family serine protease
MRVLCITLFLALTFAGAVAVPAQSFVKGELLVKYKPGGTVRESRRSMERVGARALERFESLGWVRMRLPSGMSAEDGIRAFLNFPEVEAVQPNFIYHLLATPNDTSFGSLWGMTKISAPVAWDLSTGSSSVVVAVIDSGVRYTHEDLAANMWVNSAEIPGNSLDDDGNGFVDDYYGWDFRYNDSDPMDENGHGTHVAGTIGAVGNNSVGVVGVNWNVKLMAIKIYSPAGTDTTSAMLINAYSYILMMKNRGVNIRVTNNSYGGCLEACGYDQATKDAIDALGDAGILNVFASGNSNQNMESTQFYPAGYTSPSIVSVAAADSSDAKASFSNYGTVSSDLAAPGVSTLSTYNGSNSSYTNLSGTSMATPHVAGAAALLAAHRPELSAASLKATLMNTVDPLTAWTSLVKSGGRLNVARALQTPTACSVELSPQTVRVPTKGAFVTVDVTTAPNCDFTVSSNASWAKPSSDVAGSGSSIRFWIGPNRRISRTALIAIGPQTVTITQSRN